MRMSHALFALALPWAMPCQADVIHWQLQGVTFADGAVATGFFEYETSTRSTINWDIVTTLGTAPGDPFGPGFEYTPANSKTNSNGSDTLLALIAPKTGLPRYLLDFSFQASLLQPALSVPLFTFSQEIAVPAGTAIPRAVTAGSISAVPEPAAWMSLLAGLSWLLRRKLQAA